MHANKTPTELIAFARRLAEEDYKPGAGYTATLNALCDHIEGVPEAVTPTQGNMTQKEHTAFILRVFMYWVERQTSKQVDVDLRDVLAVTRGRQMQVQLDGHMFSARTIADLTLPTAEERRSVQ